MEIHFPPLTHHSQPRFSAHISVSGQPIYGLMGGDCIHKALFLWPSLHYIEFPARDLSGSLTKAEGFPRPHPVSQRENHPAGRLPSSQAAERKKGLLRVTLSSHREGASSRQRSFVLGRMCLLTREREICPVEGSEGAASTAGPPLPQAADRQETHTCPLGEDSWPKAEPREQPFPAFSR